MALTIHPLDVSFAAFAIVATLAQFLLKAHIAEKNVDIRQRELP